MTINYDFSAWELALTGRVVCWSKFLTVVSDSQEESSPLSRKRKEDRQTNESRATKRKNFLFCSPTVPGPAKIVRIGRPRDSDRLQAGARVAGRPGPFEPDVPDGEEVPPVAEDALRRGDPGWEAGIDRRGRRAELSAHVQEESPGPLGQDRQSTRPILLHARGSVPAQGRLAPRGSSRGGNESPSFLCTRKRGEQQSLLRSFFRSFLSSFSRAIETIDFFFFRAQRMSEKFQLSGIPRTRIRCIGGGERIVRTARLPLEKHFKSLTRRVFLLATLESCNLYISNFSNHPLLERW